MKKDGKLQEFDREKIKRGLIKATWKRPVSIEQIDALIDEVEGKLRRRKSLTVRSVEIGEMVVNRLKKLDPMGYLLFASVYRDYNGLDDFEREMQELKRKLGTSNKEQVTRGNNI
jgi:transcriptional repressor NrdR